MPNWPKQNAAAMNAFYGDPDKNDDGRPDADWEARNIVRITPPYQLYYPIEDRNGRIIKRGKRMNTISVHYKVAESLMRVLVKIRDMIPPEAIVRHELDIFGGAYNFRLKRGGNTLSIHSWGAAIDLSHMINYFGKRYKRSSVWGERSPRNDIMMPLEVQKFFKEEGWTWGGLWSTPDGMHFQAANL